MTEPLLDISRKKLIVNLLRESVIKNVMNLEISDWEKRKLLWKIIDSIINDTITLYPIQKNALIKRLEVLIKQLKKK